MRSRVPSARGKIAAVGPGSLFRGLLLMAGLLIVAQPLPLRANGWEHAAIPFEALLWGLGDESSETRARAAESLGHRGQPEAVLFLLERLQAGEPEPRVRRALYIALGRLGDPAALPPLHDCLEEEDRAELRADCVAALAEIAAPDSLARLLRAFERDDDALVRRRVVESLGRFPVPAALAVLTELSEGDDFELRLRAFRALGDSGLKDAAPPLLAALERAGASEERLVILESLGRLGDSSAVASLQQILAETRDPLLRTGAVMALAAIPDGSGYPTLVGLLEDRQSVVKYYAIQGLRRLGRKEAALPLATLYERLERELGESKFDPEDVMLMPGLGLQAEILRTLTELDPKQGLAAMQAGALPVPDLARGSQEELEIAEAVYERRRLALYGLGYTESESAEALLLGPAGIGDPDARLRATAVRSLGVLGRPAAAQQVRPLLDDEVAEVRWTAAMVLGRLSDSSAVAPLLAHLSDSRSEVRRQIALALGYLGDPTVRGALLKLAFDDPSDEVRRAAAYAAKLLRKGG